MYNPHAARAEIYRRENALQALSIAQTRSGVDWMQQFDEEWYRQIPYTCTKSVVGYPESIPYDCDRRVKNCI